MGLLDPEDKAIPVLFNIKNLSHNDTVSHARHLESYSKLYSYKTSCNIVVINDDQQDATVLAYLFIPNQLYMFRAMSSPIVGST